MSPDETRAHSAADADALDLPRWWDEHSELGRMVVDAERTLADTDVHAALGALSGLEETLSGHFAVEETVYFELIERFSPEETAAVDLARRGHDRIRSVLGELRQFLVRGDRRGARKGLAELLVTFNEHELHERKLIGRLGGG